MDQVTIRRELLREVLDFVAYHSNKWNGTGEHPQILSEQLRTALEQPVVEPVIRHAYWCASLTQLLLSNPPQKAPCDCGAAPQPLGAQPQQPPVKPDRTGMRYYKNDKCTAVSADAPDCICWTPQPHVNHSLTPQKLSDEEIRAIYLANGFTVKEGQTDLKPYVFESARAIEQAVWAKMGAGK